MHDDVAAPSLGALIGRAKETTSPTSANAISLGVAVAAHAVLLLATRSLDRHRDIPVATAPMLVVANEVALVPPTPPAPRAPPPERETPVARSNETDRVAPAEEPQEAAPSAATAADVMTASADAETLDFSNDIVTGESTSYAGGTTRSDGASATAVRAGSVGSGGDGTAPSSARRARPGRLPPGHWRCDLDSGEAFEARATVVLRVDLDASGRATSVAVADAPSSSIGSAAAACARRTRFEAARDENGDAVPSTLPLLRVALTRR